MDRAAPASETPHPAQAFAARLDSVLDRLLLLVAARFRILGPVTVPLWSHISRARQRLARLLANLAAGRLPAPARPCWNLHPQGRPTPQRHPAWQVLARQRHRLRGRRLPRTTRLGPARPRRPRHPGRLPRRRPHHPRPVPPPRRHPPGPAAPTPIHEEARDNAPAQPCRVRANHAAKRRRLASRNPSRLATRLSARRRRVLFVPLIYRSN